MGKRQRQSFHWETSMRRCSKSLWNWKYKLIPQWDIIFQPLNGQNEVLWNAKRWSKHTDYEATGTPILSTAYLGDYKLVQSLWKIIQHYPIKLNIHVKYDPTFPLVDINLRESLSPVAQDTCTISIYVFAECSVVHGECE